MSRPPSSDAQTPSAGGLGCLVRVAWLFVGQGVIVLSLMLVFESRQTQPGAPDIVAWCAVLACLALRFLEITRLNGLTASGRPASLSNWRRYALILGAATLVFWALGRWTFLTAMIGL